ncbi:MAG: B12-binding domain-containing radical SAM protein [Acidobacteria bacterium]|nr:B12-binding domain-containing radical SAM protein [Acidobacteriota bacterium]
MIKKEGSIVLIHPSVRVGIERQRRIGMPLGLLAIATPLDLAGYEVTIIDQALDIDWNKRLVSALENNPICVGITSKTGPQIRNALEISKFVRKYSHAPIVWGGVHPSLLPVQTLENDNIDIVVQGEGEETFFELVQTLERGEPLQNVKGIWYQDKGQIINTEPRPFIDLNKQPSLSYHLLDINKFLVKSFGEDHFRLSSSRGCPYNCGFCYNTVFYQKTLRALDAERTFQEIRNIRSKYGVRGIRFADDFFFADIERVRKILNKIVDTRLDVIVTKLDLHVNDLDKLDDDFLQLLESAGCKALVVGIESGSQRILDLINKKISINQVIEFNKRLKKFNLIPRYCFMMGFPTETEEDIRQTVSLILQLIEDNENLVKDINIYTPYPGTDLYELSIKHGFRPPQKLEDWASLNWRSINRKRTPWITREREKLLRMLHCSSLFLEKNNFINPLWQTHPLIVLLAKFYHPFAKRRVEHLNYRFLLEIKVVEWLGLYPKQL